VGVAELWADVDAPQFGAVKGVGGGGKFHIFYVGFRGQVGRGSSEWGGASFSSAVFVDEVLLVPSENIFCGGAG
jgi:hypothetical protein